MQNKKKSKSFSNKSRVMLVDDHSIVQEGLKNLIEQESDLIVCAQAESGQDALHILDTAEPDLVILDLGLPGMNGVELIKNLKSRDAKLLILVLSMQDEMVYAERCLRSGARGYLMKNESAKKIIPAIRQILNGKIFLSEKVSERVLDLVSGGHDNTVSSIDRLSDREFEVFENIGKGLKVGQISKILNLSVKTVESYRDQIKIKFKIHSAQELTQYAVEWFRNKEKSKT